MKWGLLGRPARSSSAPHCTSSLPMTENLQRAPTQTASDRLRWFMQLATGPFSCARAADECMRPSCSKLSCRRLRHRAAALCSAETQPQKHYGREIWLPLQPTCCPQRRRLTSTIAHVSRVSHALQQAPFYEDYAGPSRYTRLRRNLQPVAFGVSFSKRATTTRRQSA